MKRPRRKVLPTVLTIGCLAAAAYVGSHWSELQPLLMPTDNIDDATATSDNGVAARDALYAGTATSLLTAVELYDSMSRESPASAQGFIGLSRSHARLAQLRRNTSLPTDAGTTAAPAIDADAANARRFAERALGIENESADAKIALLDALRLLGRDAEVSTLLQELEGTQGAEVERARGLIALGSGTAEQGLAHLRAAVAEEPRDLGTRLLLAEALIAQDNASEAREVLDALAQLTPLNTRLVALQRRLPPAPDAAAREEQDEPAVPAPVANADTPEPQELEDAPADRRRASTDDERVDESGRGGSTAVPRGRDYSWYISRGEELQERGNTGAARSHFQQALNIRPGSSEALTGMGYLALNSGDYAAAVRAFQPAAQSGYSGAYIGLGTAYRRMGRTSDALRAFENYLQRRPSGGQASIARRQVEALRSQAPAAPTAAPQEPSPAPAETAPASESPPSPAEPDPPAAAEPDPEPEPEPEPAAAPAAPNSSSDLPAAPPPPPSGAPSSSAESESP